MVSFIPCLRLGVPSQVQFLPDPRPDLFGEQLERPDDLLLRKISKEARYQHEVAETELLMQGAKFYSPHLVR